MKSINYYIKFVRDDYRGYVQCREMAAHYEVEYSANVEYDWKPSWLDKLERYLPPILAYPLTMVRGAVLLVICWYKGHKMIDDGSYAGPDSGHEALRCERCGYGWSHTYY